MVWGQGGIFGLRRGFRTFGGLGLQGHPDGSPVIIVFEGLLTEEVTESGEAIFEGGGQVCSLVARQKFDSTDSSVYIEEY